jgi:hypothetical protein
LMKSDVFIPRFKLVLPPNTTITGVKEACQELQISRDLYYKFYRLKRPPSVPGYRLLTTRRRLWGWYESLIEEPERHE